MPISDIGTKVLVTGGGGFIGSRLVHELLKEGCRVKVLDVRKGRLEKETSENLGFIGVGSDEVQGGMADSGLVEQAVEDVDVIYHLAINWDGLSWAHRLPLADLFDANVRGTLNLLEAARSRGVSHFLYSSSCAVYGNAGTHPVDTYRSYKAGAIEAADSVLHEEAVCRPELWKGDPGPGYAVLKLAVEKLCLAYYRLYGLPVTIFRLEVAWDDDEAQFVGSGDIDTIRRGGVVEVVDGDGFGTVHVDEIAQAFVLATLNEKAYGQVFNLSNPDAYISYHELYQMLARIMGSKSEIRLIMNPKLISSRPESIEKIRRILAWKPKKNKKDAEKAVGRTVQSLLKSLEDS